MKYAQVVLLKKLGEFDNGLTYSVPPHLENRIKEGVFAEIPFRNKNTKGIVIKITVEPSYDVSPDKLKSILKIYEGNSLDPKHVKTAMFISDYYHTSNGRALRLFLPKQIWEGRLNEPSEQLYKLISDEHDVKGVKQNILVDLLKKNDGQLKYEEIKQYGINNPTITSLTKKSVINKVEIPYYRPF
jgi:primosomal protein N'